jgi:hypothetical protein
MKITYYTLENNTLRKIGNVIKTDKGYVSNPSAEDYASIGAYPRDDASFTPPQADKGYTAVLNGYELADGKWVKLWRIEPITYTVDDYDQAMEDYLREVRVARGYTTREPDDYFGSSNPRWSQDAKDWVAFRDAVMTYALDVINTYTKTGKAPSLAEFKAGFPKMVWSYQEEE